MSYAQRRRFLWILLLIGVCLIAIVSQATTLIRLSFADLVRQASVIARVRCAASESVMVHGEIYTETRFDVLEPAKGDLPSQIVVRLPGGRFGHLHSRVDGAPQFQPGEELYLFLWNGGAGETFSVLGWSQGTFRIRRDARTAEEKVAQDSAETPVFDPATHAFTRTGVHNLRLEAFQEKLRQELFHSAR